MKDYEINATRSSTRLQLEKCSFQTTLNSGDKFAQTTNALVAKRANIFT